jgi:hypothetical protein
MRVFWLWSLVVSVVFCRTAAGLGEDAAERPMDGKELAVAACLQEADRLLTEYAKASKTERVKLKKKLQAIKDGGAVAPALVDPGEELGDKSQLEAIVVGKVGALKSSAFEGFPRLDVTVFRVLGKDEMLAKLQEQFYDRRGELHDLTKGFLVKMPTAKLVDGQKLPLDGVAAITGTYQLKTSVPPRTFFVLEVIDAAWLKAEVGKRMSKSTRDRIVAVLKESAK